MADVTPSELIGTGWRTYRAHPARVAIPAAIVFGVAAIGDTAIAAGIDEHVKLFPWGLLSVAVSAVSSLGLTFYAGMLDRLVGAVERGFEAPTVGNVLRTLPWGRLVVADLVLYALSLLASGLLLIPGLVVYTLFVIVGPLVNMEGHGIWGAFRRSYQLVRPNFWVALLVVTLPIFIEQEITLGTELFLHHEAIWAIFLTHALVGILFGSVVGLLEVSLAERLVFANPLVLTEYPDLEGGTRSI